MTMVAQVGGGVDVTQPPGVVTVGVKMLMLVGVHQIAVGVLVGVNMAVSVDVPEHGGVPAEQRHRRGHHRQRQIEAETGPLAQRQHAKQDTQERRQRVVGAGFCRAQLLLGQNVEADAKP